LSARSLRWPLALLLVALSGTVAHRTPVLEGRDEAEQLELARHWAGGGGFPTPASGAPRHGHQPPLGAWLLAPVVRSVDLQRAEQIEHAAPDSAPTRLSHGPLDHPATSSIARRVRRVRWVSVLCGLIVVLGTWRLARLVTGSERLAALAGALVVANPALVVWCGTLGNGPIAAAAAAVLLPVLVRLGEPDGLARVPLVGLGLACAAAALVRLSAAFLLPLALVAVLAHKLDGARARRPVERLLLGALVLLGPYAAWNLHAWGDPLALGATPSGDVALAGSDPYASLAARAADVLARLLADATAGLGHGTLPLGPALPLLHGAVLALGTLGLLGGWSALPTGPRRRAGRLLLALALAAIGPIAVLARTGRLDATLLYPAWPALATLVALGAGSLLSRPAAALGALVLLGAGAFVVLARWVPAMAPGEALDPWLVTVRPPFVEETTPRLKLRGPADGALVAEPPLLRWVPDADPTQRDAVHLGLVGTDLAWRTHADLGLLLSDRWQVPAELWERMPTGVPIGWRVVRLPRARAWERAPWGELVVPVSRVRHLERAAPD